jgi:hypothetical protein
MTIIRIFSAFAFLLVLTTSCTVITTTKVPGKQSSKFPKKMLGKFELVYPIDLEMYKTEFDIIEVEIKQKELTTFDSNGEHKLILGDSVYFSKIGKDLYLSLQAASSYHVFKVQYSGKNIELYSMAPDSGVEGLEQFCEKIENEDLDGNGEIDEEEELGMFLKVTIKDSEMSKYFKSDIPIKAPFKLKRK